MPGPDHPVQQCTVGTKVPLAEAATLHKVTKATIRRWIDRGLIAGYRLPGSTLIRVDLVEIEASMTKIDPAA